MAKVTYTVEDLIEKVESYIKDEDQLTMIKKAYGFAYEKHYGQKRMYGADYIDHPLNVAILLTRIYSDYETICAGLLHDTIEDCDATKKEITEEFNETIANLVDGVTKISKINFSTENESIVANHQKILVGLSEDVRVIIIKCADRLNNLQTLWVMPEEKQKQYAKETLEILTPIAHRLGIYQLKSEMEDLCLRYLKPDVYYDIVEKLNQTKVERDQYVNEMKEEVSSILNEHGIKHDIKGRSKSIYSIYKKLAKGRKISDLYDLLALRVIVDSEQECYVAIGLIHSKYKPIPKRFKDYIAIPKTNMYQSLHTTVFGVDGFLFEIQVRTHEMDDIAECGIASHWSYKEKKSPNQLHNAMEEKLQFFRSLIEVKNDDMNPEDFVNIVKDEILQANIYVFTPQGDVVELPNGATPIDFAYKVHTDVGNTMVGAIVNNNIVTLDYELKTGDIIKVKTNKTSGCPNKEWMNLCKTNQARNKIKSYFNKIEKDEYIKAGEDALNKELRKQRLNLGEFKQTYMDQILEELKLEKETDLYSKLGANKIVPSTVINLVTKEREDKATTILNRIQNKQESKIAVKNDIVVDGIPDMKVTIASCCNPIPGDKIIGFITRGKGITVHRDVCHNVDLDDERIIDVTWNNDPTKKFMATLLIHSNMTQNPLLDIVSKTTSSDITIDSMKMLKNKKEIMYQINVLTLSLERLNKFILDIENIPYIVYVERLIK